MYLIFPVCVLITIHSIHSRLKKTSFTSLFWKLYCLKRFTWSLMRFFTKLYIMFNILFLTIQLIWQQIKLFINTIYLLAWRQLYCHPQKTQNMPKAFLLPRTRRSCCHLVYFRQSPTDVFDTTCWLLGNKMHKQTQLKTIILISQILRHPIQLAVTFVHLGMLNYLLHFLIPL